MPTAADRLAQRHQRDIATIAGGVTSVVASVALGADPAAIGTWYWGVVDGLISRVQVGYAQSRQSGLSYLRRHAALSGASVDVVPGSLDVAALRTSLQVTGPVAFKTAIAAGHDTDAAIRSMATQMSGSAERYVRAGDRDVVEQTALRGKGVVGWRRRLGARGCGFCAMLASRGAVYVSKQRATVAKDGARYHDHCRCWAEPLYEREQEPREVRLLQRQWDRVTAGHSGLDARRVWRRHWEQRATPRARQRFGLAAAEPSGGRSAPGPAVQVRQILADAQSPEAVSRVLAAEYQRITGRTMTVDLRGSVATAREHAEGVLLAVEKYPDIEISVARTGKTARRSSYAEADQMRREIVFSENWSSVARRQDYLGALVMDARRGWHPKGMDNPTGVAMHEAGHLWDPDSDLVRIDLEELLEQAAGPDFDDIRKLVTSDISVYAMRDERELIAEAFADVIARGDRASALSRSVVRLVEDGRAVSGVRGSRVGPLPSAPDLSRLTVARLRALVAAHGITVPTGLRKPALVKLADDLDSGVPAATARERAVASIVDERRGIASALTRALEVEGLSERAMRSVATSLRRELSPEQVKTLKPLLEALDAADAARLRAAVPVVARSAKLKQIGEPGAVTRLPAAQVEWIGPGRSGVVSVVRPGWETTAERRVVLLQRAAGQAATPEQAARLAPVKAAKKAAKAAPAKKATARAAEVLDFDLEARATAEGVSATELAEITELIRIRQSRIIVGDETVHGDLPLAALTGDPRLAAFYRAHPDIYNHLAQRFEIERAWEPLAYRDRQAAATRAVRRAVAPGNPIVVRQQTEEQLRSILADGRFKTQFETGTSGGGIGGDVRADFEAFTFGLPRDLPVQRRPVYGYVAVGGIDADTGAKLAQYGEVRIVLRDDVRARTTVTAGDSIDRQREVLPMPIDAADWHAVPPSVAAQYDGFGTARFRQANYVEAQIHGGVTVDDIEEVVFRQQPEVATVTALERAGVSWRVGTAAPAKKATPTAQDLTGARGLSTDPAVREVQIENRIRQAYERVPKLEGGGVVLRQIRPLLDDLPQAEVDAVLVRLGRERGSSLTPIEGGDILSRATGQRLSPEALRPTGVTVGGERMVFLRITDPSLRPLPTKAAKKATPRKAVAPKAPPAPERMTAPALRKELTDRGVTLDVTGVPKPVLAEHVARLRSGSPAAAETARLRQAVIDRQRAAAETLAEAVEILDIGAEALGVRARARLRRIEQTITGWPQEAPIRSLLTAMQTGNPATIRRAVATAERRLGLTRVEASTMDRSLMTPVGGTIRDGARVEVVRPGYTVEIGGERVVLSKAVVREASVAPAKATAKKATPAKRAPAKKATAARPATLDDVLRLRGTDPDQLAALLEASSLGRLRTLFRELHIPEPGGRVGRTNFIPPPASQRADAAGLRVSLLRQQSRHVNPTAAERMRALADEIESAAKKAAKAAPAKKATPRKVQP